MATIDVPETSCYQLEPCPPALRRRFLKQVFAAALLAIALMGVVSLTLAFRALSSRVR